MNGCYWHGHADCLLFRPPKTRTEFWTNKIEGNQARDQRNYAALEEAGWAVLVIWECAVSKKLSQTDEQPENAITSALASTQPLIDIRG